MRDDYCRVIIVAKTVQRVECYKEVSSVSDFSFTKDFKRIDLGQTLLVGFERSLAAGLVWFVVALFVPELQSDAWGFLLWPLSYFVFILPVGVVLSLLSKLPGIAGMVFGLWYLLWALLIVVGDPLVFIVHKIKPKLVPVEEFRFLNFACVIFVLKPVG